MKKNNAINSMKYSTKFGKLLITTLVAAMLTGCAIGPSPHFSNLGNTGTLLLLLIAVAGYFLWYTQNYKLTAKPTGNNTEPNNINNRLDMLEKEIQIIKTQIKREHHA